MMPPNNFKTQPYQERLAKHLFSADEAVPRGVSSMIYEGGVSIDGRLSIYRHNVVGGLEDVILKSFPPLVPVVVKEFAHAMARSYIYEYPPETGNLNDYAANYPDFVRAFKPAQEILFLADVAHIENNEHRAYYAEFVSPLTINNLAEYAGGLEEGDILLDLHPATQLMVSDYPALDIRNYAQKDDETAQAPQVVGDLQHFYCTARQDMRVSTYEITHEEYIFLERVSELKQLNRALQETINMTKNFDFTKTWQNFLKYQIFIVKNEKAGTNEKNSK